MGLKLAMAAWLLYAAPAWAAELVVLVDASTEMPWAEVQDEGVGQGLHRDLGEALAQRLGREARFLALPRKRLGEALLRGPGDLTCAMQPAWLPGDFHWSRRFLPDVELLLTLRSAPRPASVQSLSGQAIGTISGFVYPELQRQLGAGFVRDDAPNASANLRKLNIGRMQHATLNLLYVDYQRRQGLLTAPLHPYLVLSANKTQCALSRRSSLALADLDRALTGLVNDGTLDKLLGRYR